MRDPLRGEATATTEDGELRLVVDNAALIAAERLLDMSFLSVAGHLLDAEASGEQPRLEIMQGLLWAALRADHAEFTPAHCGDLLLREGLPLRGKLVDALVGALPRRRGDVPGEATAPTTRSAPGTGKRSPSATSRPAAG